MKPEEELELFKRATKNWGSLNQLDMVIEEAAELIQAINKAKRKDFNVDSVNDLCQEIADVEIMIDQLKIILNENDLINRFRIEKVERLRDRLDKYESSL